MTRRDSFSSYAQDANAEVTTDGRAKSKTRNGRAGFLRGLKARLIEKKAVGFDIDIDMDCSRDQFQRLQSQRLQIRRYFVPAQVTARIRLCSSTSNNFSDK